MCIRHVVHSYGDVVGHAEVHCLILCRSAILCNLVAVHKSNVPLHTCGCDSGDLHVMDDSAEEPCQAQTSTLRNFETYLF
jgi:hypothetical protein